MKIAPILALLLTGCVSTMLENQLGKPIQSFVAEKGPPNHVYELPDGRRGFQWASQSTFTVPVAAYTTQTGNIAHTSLSGGQNITSTCRMTLIAVWNPSRNAWIAEEYRYAGC